MRPVLVDSNVLLDLLTEDPVWFDWSKQAMDALTGTVRLIINPVIYAEVSSRFSNADDLDMALPPAIVEREPVPFPAAFAAGRAFREYRMRGGARTSLLPDFLIGAHAEHGRYQLLTRDIGRYRTYFPNVSLIAPQRSPS